MSKIQVSIRGTVQLSGEVRSLDIDAEVPASSWCVGALISDLLRSHLSLNPQFSSQRADAVVLAISVVNVGKPRDFYAPLFAEVNHQTRYRLNRTLKKGVDHNAN